MLTQNLVNAGWSPKKECKVLEAAAVFLPPAPCLADSRFSIIVHKAKLSLLKNCLFLATLGLFCCCAQAFTNYRELGLLLLGCVAFSFQWPLVAEHGLQGMWASGVVVRGL